MLSYDVYTVYVYIVHFGLGFSKQSSIHIYDGLQVYTDSAQ